MTIKARGEKDNASDILNEMTSHKANLNGPDFVKKGMQKLTNQLIGKENQQYQTNFEKISKMLNQNLKQ